MGDGAGPVRRRVRKRRLEPRDGETAFDAVREALGDDEAEVPKGSVAVGRRVRLPAAPSRRSSSTSTGSADRGRRLRARRGEIVFSRPIVKEQVGGMRWLAMLLGLFGTYRRHETVDVEYRLGGQVKLASDVEILPG